MRYDAAWLVALLAVCAGAFAPRASAQSACHAENDGPTFADSAQMWAPMVAVRFDASQSFEALRVELWTGESSGTQEVGLWLNDPINEEPWFELSSGAFVVQQQNGWQGASLTSPVPLGQGETYWVVWKPTLGCQMSVDVPGSPLFQIYQTSPDDGQSWSGPIQLDWRPWKLRIFGDCVSTPTTYCTSGTSVHGCSGTMVALEQPELGSSTPCIVRATNLEPGRVGVIFYGLSSQAVPWCTQGSGSSFLCVRQPLMRAKTGLTGGGGQPCDGTLTLDWTALQSQPGATLGKPWGLGDQAYVQCWFRDPGTCRHSSTTNAIELLYVP